MDHLDISSGVESIVSVWNLNKGFSFGELSILQGSGGSVRAHTDLPNPVIVEYAHIHRDRESSCVYISMFTYQDFWTVSQAWCGVDYGLTVKKNI